MADKATLIRRLWEGDPGVNPFFKAIFIFLAYLYAGGVRLWAMLYHCGLFSARRLPCKVVSVGNITSGGTGKTPMVMYLARYFIAKGLRVAIVSRGYKGGLEAKGGLVSDGRRILVDACQAGDEPFMMARALPGVSIAVGADRYRAARRVLQNFFPDVILLDDAFQHLKLKRDLDLVLLDGTRPFGNGYTLPAGELREPLPALRRADALVLTRTAPDHVAGRFRGADTLLTGKGDAPVFKTRHVAVIRKIIPAGQAGGLADTVGGQDRAGLKGRRVYAFSGVAKNDEFRYTLYGFDCEVAGSREFPDHHRYSGSDLDGIRRQAAQLAVDCIVTTEKDYARIKPFADWPAALVVVGIDISFEDDKERFHSFLAEKLTFSKK